MAASLFKISDLVGATSYAIRNISEDVPCVLPRVLYRYATSSSYWERMKAEAPFIKYFNETFDEDDVIKLITHLFNSYLHICKKVRCIQGVTKHGCVWPTLEKDLIKLTKCNVIEYYIGPSEVELWQKRFTIADDARDDHPTQYVGHWFFVSFWICLRALENIIYENAFALSLVASNYVFVPAVIEAISQLGPKGRILLSKIWDKDSMGLSIITVTYSVSWAVLGVEKKVTKHHHYRAPSNDIGVRRQYADSQLYRTILARIIATRIILAGDLTKDGEDCDDFVEYVKKTNIPIDIVTEVLYSFMESDEDKSLVSIARSIGLHHVVPSLAKGKSPASLTMVYTLARDAVEAHSRKYIRPDEPNCSIRYHDIYLLLTATGVFQRLGELVQWHAAYHPDKKTAGTRQHIQSSPLPMEQLPGYTVESLIKDGYASIVDGRMLLEHPRFEQFCHFAVPVSHCAAVSAIFAIARFVREAQQESDIYPRYPSIDSSWYTGNEYKYKQTNFIDGCDEVLAKDPEDADSMSDEDEETAAAEREYTLLTEINRKLTDTSLSGVAPLVGSNDANSGGSLRALVERLLSVAKDRLANGLLDNMMEVEALSREGRGLGNLPSITSVVFPGKNVMITRCLSGCIISVPQSDAELFCILSMMMTRFGEKKLKSYTSPISGFLYKLYKTDRKNESKAVHRTIKSLVYQYLLTTLLTTVRLGSSHTMAYISQDLRPMDKLHRDDSLQYLHQDISRAMLERTDEVTPESTSLVESPIDFYELYLERLVEILFPESQDVVEMLKQSMDLQFTYMANKSRGNKQLPPVLRTLVVFFLQKKATEMPKDVASRLQAHFQKYIYSTEYIELEGSKKRLIATAYRTLGSMLPKTEDTYSIPRAQDMHPSYCYEVEPVGVIFAATIECPTMDNEEKREMLMQIEPERPFPMASPQALGSWAYASNEIMQDYNRIYGNDKYKSILDNPALREAWMEEQPRLGLVLLALEVLNGLKYDQDHTKAEMASRELKYANHFDTLGPFKPDFRKWEEWDLGNLLKHASTCGIPFFTNTRIHNKFRQVLASPLNLLILSGASVGSYASMLQE